MAHNNNWFYHAHQGVMVTKEFTAEIGLEFGPDNDLAFYLDSEAYQNFTVTDEGITGDDIEPGTAPDTIYVAFLDPERNSDIMDSNYSPRSAYNIGDHIKVAIYITDTTTETDVSYSYPSILFYDSNNDSFLGTYFNPSNQYVTNLNINNTTKLKMQYLQAGGSVIPLDYKIGNICAPNRFSINNTWVTNDLFYGLKFATNIPVFDTEAHAKDYLRDSTALTGLLNKGDEDPEGAYKEQFDYWFIYSTVGHNTRNSLSPDNVSDFLRWPKSENDKICFLVHEPTSNEPWKLELHYYEGMDAYRSDSEDGVYEPTYNVPWKYLDRSISFGMDDYYTQFGWLSNIPRADSLEQMEDYFNGVIDISQMANFKEIARIDNSIVDPNFPGTDKDEVTSLGENGMQYTYGCRLYAITNLELAALFNELFDPLNLENILDGQKIFGTDGIMQSVAGILYIPLADLSPICDLGSSANVKIGSWQSQNSQGNRINGNKGTIDCGTFTLTPTFADFRDMEPYTLLFVVLPFVGMKQLTVSKYYGKSVTCRFACDVTTGACCYMLMSDGIMLDCFDGTCSASRPLSATDNNAYINNILSAVTGASNNASGSVSGVANAVGSASKMATAGGAMGAAGGAAGVAVAGAGVVGSGIFAGYEIKNAVDNPPQMSRGNLAGNLSYNANDQIYFVIAQKRTIRPENELATIGMPSGHGAAIGQFSGFLSCSAVKIQNGMIPTETEEAEIIDILKGGIYI